MNRIIHGDCLDELKKLPDNSIDSCVTDPPYGLSKELDIVEVLTKWLDGEDYHHRGGGFMGKTWDSFVPGPSIWREVYRVLKPGAHLLCFAGTRTQDLMTISLRLAGFEIRDVVEWLYFSGFPKSLDVGKQFDKRKGGASFVHEFAKLIKKKRLEKGYSLAFMDKEVCGGTTNYSWFEGRPAGVRLPQLKEYYKIKELLDLDDTYDELMEAAEREKIGEKKSGIANAFGGGEWKSGPAEVVDITAPATPLAKKWDGWGTALKPAHEPIILARKPLDGTVADNVERWGTGALNIDGCRIRFDNFKAVTGKGGGILRYHGFSSLEELKEAAERGEKCPDGRDAMKTYLRAIDAERVKPVEKEGRFPANCVTTEPDAFFSKYFNVTPPELSKKASKRDRLSTWDGGQVEANRHPTVKPTDLMAWLVRLVTPPGGTVLDPFAGSGSTLVAAKREGFSYVGIEREEEYVEIARARVVGDPQEENNLPEGMEQMELFDDAFAL